MWPVGGSRVCLISLELKPEVGFGVSGRDEAEKGAGAK